MNEFEDVSNNLTSTYMKGNKHILSLLLAFLSAAFNFDDYRHSIIEQNRYKGVRDHSAFFFKPSSLIISLVSIKPAIWSTVLNLSPWTNFWK